MPTQETYISRRAARELAFQFLFSLSQTSRAIHRFDFQVYCDSFATTFDEFAWEIVDGTLKSLTKLDELISSHSKNWRIERMPKIDLAILRLAAFEITHRVEIPKSVSINEAVELAKKFGAEGSPSFVNGILDNFSKEGFKP